MFGEHFGLDYHRQRHVELVQAAERARLVRCLEAGHSSGRRRTWQGGLHKQVLAAAGGQLIRLGQFMQQAAFAVR